MKNLTEYINESLVNESFLSGALSALVVGAIYAVICLVEIIYYGSKDENQYFPSADFSLKSLMKNDGILLGFTEWLFHKFGDFKDVLDDARVRKEIEKIKSSDAFKEYLKLPKNKRTLKKLIEIGNIVNTKDNFAVYSIWDAYKKETRVSNKELEKEIKETK